MVGGYLILNNFHRTTDIINNYCTYNVSKQVQQTVQVRRKGQRRKRPRPLRISGQRRKNASVQLQFASRTRVSRAKSRSPRNVTAVADNYNNT